LRDWGQEVKYEHRMLAFNARMDGFQGAVLRVKLPHLEAWTQARRALAARYAARLAEGPVAPPRELPGRRHVWHCYTVRVPDRPRVQKALAERGVGSGVVYPIPLHRQPLFAGRGLGPGSFPEAERAAEEVLSLPLYPGLAEDAVDRVATALREALTPVR
ncbi:MAG: DegT/DnrJ/EryC1/StrS family aminotransferase, partial [Myxococcota bacterium]|nr:DegT/DnrJ/EryC1/StrS family aminotransferase [Myxococcota bacterium]